MGREAACNVRSPRSLIDKLGVKAGMRVGILGLDEDASPATSW